MTEEVTMAQVLQAVTELSQDLKATESRLNDKFDKVEVRLTRVEEKVDQVEVRLTGVEEKVEQVEVRLTGVEEKVDQLEVRLTGVEEKVEQVEVKLTGIEKNTIENGEKIDRFDDKLSIVTDELLSTKADVKRLKNVQ